MVERPIIEVVDIAERMDRCLEATPDDVTRAFHESESPAAARASLTSAQRKDYADLRALVTGVARYRLPGTTLDHSDLYDENGLPV